MAKITQQMPKVCLMDALLNSQYYIIKLHFVTYRFDVFCVQVHIEFTEGEDRITLEGPTKDVQMVQGQIETIVTDLVSVDLPIQLCLRSKPKAW